MAFLFFSNMVNARTRWLYYVVGFVVVWTQILESGVHATIAGVLMGFAFPTNAGMLPKDYAAKAKKLLGKLEDKGPETIFRGMPDAETSDTYFELKQLTKRERRFELYPGYRYSGGARCGNRSAGR